MLPASYKSSAGTWTVRGFVSTYLSKRRASASNSSFLVLIHLIRTELSTTIFPAIAGVSVVANDISRVPLADPLLFEFPQGSESFFPLSVISPLLSHLRAQCVANDLGARSALGLRGAVQFFQDFVGYGNHYFGHGKTIAFATGIGK